MAFHIPTDALQGEVLEFLQTELGSSWEDLTQEQRDLVVRVAINYGREQVKLFVARYFQGINVEETQANIENLKVQLQVLGLTLQAQVFEVLNKAVMKALQALLAQFVTGDGSAEAAEIG